MFGGGKRIVNAIIFLVPFMGMSYILVAIVITLMDVSELPSIFKEIFVCVGDDFNQSPGNTYFE